MNQSRGVGVAGRTMRAHGTVFDVISPHTEESIAEVAAAGPADVDAAVDAARAAFDSGPWGRSEPLERVEGPRQASYDRVVRGGIRQLGIEMFARLFPDVRTRFRFRHDRKDGFTAFDMSVVRVPA